jgi:hypothetical protein
LTTRETLFAFFYHRAGCQKQFDPFKKTIKQKKWVIVRVTCFLISTSLCKSHMSIYCFGSFQDSKKKKKEAKVLSVSTFFINLLHKAKLK